MRSFSYAEATSTSLIDPTILYTYTEDHQERLWRAHEATTTDESARRDRALEIQGENVKRGQWAMIVLIGLIPVIGAVVSLVLESEWPFVFSMASPIITALSKITPGQSANRRDD